MSQETNPSKRGSRQYSTNKSRVYAIQPNGDQVLPNGNIVNWNRGILNQLWKVDSCYNEWISHAKIRQIRMFDSDFLEGGSFTFWWVVPCLYIPWGLLEIYTGHRILTGTYPFLNQSNNISSPSAADISFTTPTNQTNDITQDITTSSSTFNIYNPISDNLLLPVIISCIVYSLIGLIIWSLFEYFAHRFLFHWSPQGKFQNMVHFLGHGLHHLTPVDDLRLVFPPAISIPIGLGAITFFKLLFPIGIANCLAAGFGIGYALYESTHYLSHHYGHLLEIPNGNKSKINNILKEYIPFIINIKDIIFNIINSTIKWYLGSRFKYHSAHHFNDKKKNSLYGVTSQIWDVVFGTF